MKVFRILDKLKSNFVDTKEWTRSWENDEEYMDCLKTEIKDNKNPWMVAINIIRPGSKVLSAGCGAGREVRYLVREKKCKVTALDISKKMLDSSKKIEPKASYILADMTNYISNEKFDYIVCLWNTINFLPNYRERRKFIKTCEKNLKQGGKLILTTGHKFISLKIFVLSLLNFSKNYYYSPGQINKWFKDTCFKYHKKRLSNELLIVARKDE